MSSITVWKDELPATYLPATVIEVAARKLQDPRITENPDLTPWSRPNGIGTGFIVEWKRK